MGSFREGGQSQQEAMGLVLGLFTCLPDLNMERQRLPTVGSHHAHPWSLRIKPTWGREGGEDEKGK